MSGYIKLHRKILDNGVFENGELLKVFVWCILRANTKPAIVFGKKIKAGQFLTGRVSASQELRIPPTTVYDRLKKLQKMDYIKIESNTKNTIISVLKFKDYQHNDKEAVKRDLDSITEQFTNSVMEYKETYTDNVLDGFISYWTEPNRSGTKLRFELQQTFEVSRRLKTWNTNQENFKPNQLTKADKPQVLDSWQQARNIINNG